MNDQEISHKGKLKALQKDLPPSLEPIIGAHISRNDLSDIERIMLACDGTFTFQLEAFFRETIEVDILHFAKFPLGKNTASFLKTSSKRDVWDRMVLLRGAQSKKPYVFARSHIDIDRLPVELQQDLKTSPAGLGRLFVDYRLSIYRQLLGFYFEDGSQYQHLFADRKDLSFLARVYRVYFVDKPVMLITEMMPRDLFTKI